TSTVASAPPYGPDSSSIKWRSSPAGKASIASCGVRNWQSLSAPPGVVPTLNVTASAWVAANAIAPAHRSVARARRGEYLEMHERGGDMAGTSMVEGTPGYAGEPPFPPLAVRTPRFAPTVAGSACRPRSSLPHPNPRTDHVPE